MAFTPEKRAHYHPVLERSAADADALDLDSDQSGNLRDEIVRIEDRIEQLTEKIESCRKLIWASQIAVAGGALVLAGCFSAQSGSIPL